jgi:hypothetical protein
MDQKNIWVFGDSFSVPFKRIENERGSDDYRTSYKMYAFLMFYYIHGNRQK